eukprot:9949104-Ditylum_brightwellii.AAC.1
MEDHCKKVAKMQLKDPTTPPYFEISEHTHNEVIGVFSRLFVPRCGVLTKKDFVLMFSHLKDVIITYETMEGEISKLKGQDNQLRQKHISLTLNDKATEEGDSGIDKESILDMNDGTVNMDNLADNMV